MKQLIFISTMILFCLPASKLSGQVEFAPVGAKYHYWGEYQNNNEGPFIPYISSLEVLGDTLIAGQNCRKMSVDSRLQWNCDDLSTNLMYAYEEEEKVYWWNERSAAFELLYDFTKNAGESWEVPAYCGNVVEGCELPTFTINVDSVSYVEMNGISLKVQHVSSAGGNVDGYTFAIYAGIGCTSHFFYWPEYYCTTIHDYFRGLRCFESPVDGTFSFYTDAGSCDMIVANETIRNTDKVAIFPNPFTDLFSVHFEGDFDLMVTDTQGREVRRASGLSETTTVNLSDQPAGVYYIILENSSKRVVQKIVKTLH